MTENRCEMTCMVDEHPVGTCTSQPKKSGANEETSTRYKAQLLSFWFLSGGSMEIDRTFVQDMIEFTLQHYMQTPFPNANPPHPFPPIQA